MFSTLLERVKANIDEKKEENDQIHVKGWAFSEDHGVCPIRCKYDGTIRGVDIELRKDVCDRFGKTNIILCGWKVSVPLDKFIDFQMKLSGEWQTFLTYHSLSTTSTVMLPNAQETNKKSETVDPSLVTFSSSTPSLSQIYVMDDFYDDPESIRQLGLQSLEQPSTYILPASLQDKFEKIVGQKMVSFSQYPENGRFHLTNRFVPVSFETIPYQMAGIVFLTPDAPMTGGITFYRSKVDSTDLEAMDLIGNRFNRLVLFPANRIHSVTHHFGLEKQDSRLVQIFAFNLV
jgi:hypothetical protein